MFTTRSIDDIPNSIKFLMDAIIDKPVQQLYLNDNAIGFRAISSFSDMLTKSPSLKVLNLTNCGLSSASIE